VVLNYIKSLLLGLLKSGQLQVMIKEIRNHIKYFVPWRLVFCRSFIIFKAFLLIFSKVAVSVYDRKQWKVLCPGDWSLGGG
jgi:hypothetical protein